MYCKKKNAFLISLVVCVFTLFSILSCRISAKETQTKRLSGSDRYKTAVAISQEGWPQGSDYVIIARGDEFADALCAGPLAQKCNAPILLTQPDKLNTDILNEVIRLKAKNVIIVGGIGAVSEEVVSALNAAGINNVKRIWGNDRYETSVKIAEKVGTSTSIVIATGADFPDALSISAIASQSGMPILLTMRDSIPESVKNYISTNTQINRTYIVGGTGVIGSAVEGLMPSPKRLGGRDRYETNSIILKEFASQLNFKTLYIAVGDGIKGDEFADALTGAVLAAKNSSPVILVYKNLSSYISDSLKEKLTEDTVIIALGGDGAVPSSVLNEVLTLTTTSDKLPSVTPTPPAGGAPGGGAAPGADTVNLSSIKIITSPPNSLGAVSNGGEVDLRSLGQTVQVEGFNIVVDSTCSLKLTGILNKNGTDVMDILLELYNDELSGGLPTVTINGGTETFVDLDELLKGLTKGNNGISLKRFRDVFDDKTTIQGKIIKDGKDAGVFSIVLLL